MIFSTVTDFLPLHCAMLLMMAATDLASFYLLLLSQNRGIFKTSFKSKCSSSLEVVSVQISKYFHVCIYMSKQAAFNTYHISIPNVCNLLICSYVLLILIKILIKNISLQGNMHKYLSCYWSYGCVIISIYRKEFFSVQWCAGQTELFHQKCGKVLFCAT